MTHHRLPLLSEITHNERGSIQHNDQRPVLPPASPLEQSNPLSSSPVSNQPGCAPACNNSLQLSSISPQSQLSSESESSSPSHPLSLPQIHPLHRHPPSNALAPVPGSTAICLQAQDTEADSDEEDEDEDQNRYSNSNHYIQFGDMENEEILHYGYLDKKGARRKTWKRRWFVLRKTSLVYYKNDKEYRLLRMIPLTDIHTCAEVQVKHHDNTFGIVTPTRTYYVRSKTRAERDQWTHKVTEAKDQLRFVQRANSLPLGSPANHPPNPPIKRPQQPTSGDELISKSLPHHLPSNTPALSARSNHIDGPLTDSDPVAMGGDHCRTPIGALSYTPIHQILNSQLASITNAPSLNTTFITNYAPSANFVQSPEPPSSSSGMSSWTSDYIQPQQHGTITRASIMRYRAGANSLPLADSVADSHSQPLPPFPLPDLSSGGSSAGGFNEPLTSSSVISPPQLQSCLLSSSCEDEEDDEDEDSTNVVAQPPRPLVHQPQKDPRLVSSGPMISTDGGILELHNLEDVKSISPKPSDRKISLPEAVQGYLMKQGKRKTWRKRYFVLTSQKLVYSKSHMVITQITLKKILVRLTVFQFVNQDTTGRNMKEIPIGRILDAIEVDKNETSSTSGGGGNRSGAPIGTIEEHYLKIITSDKTLLVNAPTEEEEIKWISAIRCLTNSYRANLPLNKPFGEILDQCL